VVSPRLGASGISTTGQDQPDEDDARTDRAGFRVRLFTFLNPRLQAQQPVGPNDIFQLCVVLIHADCFRSSMRIIFSNQKWRDHNQKYAPV